MYVISCLSMFHNLYSSGDKVVTAAVVTAAVAVAGANGADPKSRHGGGKLSTRHSSGPRRSGERTVQQRGRSGVPATRRSDGDDNL